MTWSSPGLLVGPGRLTGDSVNWSGPGRGRFIEGLVVGSLGLDVDISFLGGSVN